MEERSKKKIHGGRNLLLLGVISTVVALVTTGVSLVIYHNSGDIYLDRSRPGFLPDQEELEQEEQSETVYDFTKQSEVTAESLEEYLTRLEEETKTIDAYVDPFDAEILSDEHFGIPVNEN